MDTIEHEAKVWRTVTIVAGVAFCVLVSGAGYCSKNHSDNYRARAVACIEAKGTWIPQAGDGLCLFR